jgi:hypothetical protein
MRSKQGPQRDPLIKQMANNSDHTKFRAPTPARADLAQPGMTVGMVQHVGAQLREAEQGRRYQGKPPRPRRNVGNPGRRKAQVAFGIAKAFLTPEAAGILPCHGQCRQRAITDQVPIFPMAFFVAGPGLGAYALSEQPT